MHLSALYRLIMAPCSCWGALSLLSWFFLSYSISICWKMMHEVKVKKSLNKGLVHLLEINVWKYTHNICASWPLAADAWEILGSIPFNKRFCKYGPHKGTHKCTTLFIQFSIPAGIWVLMRFIVNCKNYNLQGIYFFCILHNCPSNPSRDRQAIIH